MPTFYLCRLAGLAAGLSLAGLSALTASAQAPAWTLATTSSPEQLNGSSSTIDVATDASGNVFVTGDFDGQVTFGTTTLTSAGQLDFFVAKYVPATNTWAWAQRGGGTRNDVGHRLVVSGTSVYVTGYITNSVGNGSGVYLGGTTPDNSPAPQSGCSFNDGQDLFVAKYIDQGTSATLAWSQAAGGTGADLGYGIAVSGASVYVTGTIFNNTANASSVVFGGSGLAAGTLPQPGASPTASPDLVLARYTDQGTSATVAWVQVGGGTGADIGYGVAASGSSVYVTGSLVNTSTNANGVLLGGAGATPGTVPQYGASPTAGPDLLLAKYTDAGPSASVTWTQVGGGTGEDMGSAVAVSAGSVYVVGTLTNNFGNGSGVLFGGSGTTAGTVSQSGVGTSLPNSNLVLAKYLDNGPTATVAWTQVGGGTSSDAGRAIAVSGSSLYVVGTILNDQANTAEVVFGGSGAVAGTSGQAGASGQRSFDLVVAKYTDQGASATVNWTQVGGGTTSDYGYGVAASGGSVYVAGLLGSYTGLFGTAAGSPLLGCRVVRAVLGQLSDNGTAGPWQRVAASFNGGLATTTSTATDASGNVFVAGYFDGQLRFGSTLLSSAGSTDAFVAKYVPATGTWAWAHSAGGVGADQGQGLAVSGGSVYLTGFIDNDSGNSQEVGFGGTNLLTRTAQQPGATSTRSFDLFVAKYTDNGPTATLGWTQVGGGTGWDQGYALAVSGSSVYVAGSLTNNKLDGSAARFGGSGLVPGTVPQYGAASTTSRDMLLAKYTDNGPTATLNWTQVAGGTDWDEAYALAVGSGGSVYVAGTLYNSLTNANQAVFGGAGTVPGTVVQHGASPASGYDVVLAKYTDNGPSATVAWTQVGGGTNIDYGYGVAVSGNRLYVTGSLINTPTNTNGVLFGGSGTMPGTAPQHGIGSSGSPDLLLAKYTDNGPTATLGWTQVAGGTGSDYGTAVVASGNNVYVAGALTNSRTNSSGVQFGGSGTTPGTVVVNGATATTSRDVLVARYVDTGPSATVGWAQVGGGTGLDIGYGLALAGPRLYVAGSITPAATFGALPTLGTSPSSTLVFLGSFDGSATLATTAAAAGPALSLFPNPAAGPASLRGAPAGAAVGVFDALGRRVATATADARGTAALPGGLRPGLYVVRAGTGTARWMVE